ncbi:MAG TPA: class I SAM-dependent DNA methyltransferase [Elusimicrobiota bacterium]|nr:class I SAM-dependent DNA methyltransferase [Elusimicrobiota bacterium]
MAGNNSDIENRLWESADQLWANSNLRPSEFSTPVLGLIFLRYADYKFTQAEEELAKSPSSSGRRKVGKVDYQAKGVLYIPEEARFSRLHKLPEGADLPKALNEAMKAIEEANEELKDILPKTYRRLDNATLIELLRIIGSIPMDIEGDAFGKIYEYFLGEFAMKEGQKGGEFFTPTSIVKLIVEVIEPYHGRIFDPACGSGGMFVQSGLFVQHHKKNPCEEIMIYGQEKVEETIRLCKMNLAVRGLSGDIRQGNMYYEDLHNSTSKGKPGKFDFVMANPPFNVSGVDMEKIKDDPRFRLGVPSTDNANYLWIQAFYHALNEKGRAGFVMANSAADARGSELEIRKKLIQSGDVDVVISVGNNFFYTVTLPCTLWFFDRGKGKTSRKNDVLFIDSRHIFRQIDRAHREFTPQQVEFIANIVRLHREEKPENMHDSANMLKEQFPKGKYVDVPGLCKVATVKEIEEQGWSLNPGRYVGVTEKIDTDQDFHEQIKTLNSELEKLNAEANKLEVVIGQNVSQLLGKIK